MLSISRFFWFNIALTCSFSSTAQLYWYSNSFNFYCTLLILLSSIDYFYFKFRSLFKLYIYWSSILFFFSRDSSLIANKVVLSIYYYFFLNFFFKVSIFYSYYYSNFFTLPSYYFFIIAKSLSDSFLRLLEIWAYSRFNFCNYRSLSWTSFVLIFKIFWYYSDTEEVAFSLSSDSSSFDFSSIISMFLELICCSSSPNLLFILGYSSWIRLDIELWVSTKKLYFYDNSFSYLFNIFIYWSRSVIALLNYS